MAVRSTEKWGFRSWVNRWMGRTPSRPGSTRVRPQFVELETRDNPAYVFVDFGDNFPAGGLSDTLNNFKNLKNGANPSVNGPDLTFIAAGTSTLTIQSYNSVFGAVAATNRAEIMQIVRRYYEPTGITVVELKSTPTIVDGFSFVAAKSLADVSATLGLNEGKAQNNDSYALVGQGTVTGFDLLLDVGLAGIANGTDLGTKSNLNDDTCLSFVTAAFPLGNLFDADTITHENGHNLGLRHVYQTSGGTIPGQNWLQLTQSEIMSYNRAPSGSTSDAMTMFSRFPTILGDGNTNPDQLSVNAPNKGTYDQLLNDPEVGGNSSLNYVSGTGANDIITITKTGANQATVTVAPFANNTYSSALLVPGGSKIGQTVHTYTISLDRKILIDAGPGADRLTIANNLGVSVLFRGMEGIDSLVVQDAGGAAVTHQVGSSKGTILDTSSDYRATISFAGTTIQMTELEPTSSITINNASTVTYISPGGVDKITVAAGGGGTKVTGTVFGGITAIPLTLTNVNSLALNLGNGDGAGANDALTISFASGNPIPPGGLSYDGGTGTDSVTVSSNTDFTLSNTKLDLGALGFVGLANVEVATLTGGASGNIFTIDNWSGQATVDGGTGSDTIVFTQDSNITLQPTKLSTSTGTTIQLASIENASLSGGPGDNTFDLTLWLGSSTVKGLGGIDTLKLVRDANFTAADALITVSDGTSYPVSSVELIELTGGAGNNTFNLNAWSGGGTLTGLGGTDDVALTRDADFSLNASSLSVSGGLPITIATIENATLTGGPSSNTFTLVGWQGNAVLDGGDESDRYVITPGTKTSVIQIADSGLIGLDEVEIIGTSGNDNYTIEPDAVISGLQRVQYANIESVLVDGRDGDDTFVTDINKGFFSAGPFTLEGGTGQNTFVITGTPATLIQQSGVLFTGGTSGKIMLDPDGSITPSLTGPLNGDELIIPFNNMSKIGDVTPAVRFDFAFTASSDSISVTDGGVFAGTPTVQVFDGVRGVSVARKTRVVISGGGGTDSFSLDTTAAVPGVTAFDLIGSTGVDAFTVKAVNLPVSLLGEGGDDQFTFGSTTSGLDKVTGAITINGGTGTNAVSFNDAASATANAAVTVSSTGITGLTGNGASVVSFVPGTVSSLAITGASSFANTIAVSPLGFPLSLATGTAADKITLAAVGAAATVITGDGADSVQIDGLSTGLVLFVQEGDDTVSFNAPSLATPGSLDGFTTGFTFDGGTGTDTAIFNDAADTTGNAYALSSAGLTRSGGVALGYTNVESAKVYGGGSGSNTFAVMGLSAGVTVVDGAGNGTFNIAGDTLGGTNSFQGGDGKDTFQFEGSGLAAATTIDAGPGIDTATVRGTTGDDSITITTNALTGSIAGAGAGTLTYTGLESAAVDSGNGSNGLTYVDGSTLTLSYVYVPATAGSGKLTGPAGTTELSFTNTAKSLTFNGGSARDQMTVWGVSTTGQGTGVETTSGNGIDTLTISDKNVAISNASIGILRSLAISSNAGVPTVKTLIVRTGNESGDSGDQVTVTPSTSTNILIYGGGPAKTPGDKLVVNTVGPRTVSLDTDISGNPITRVTQISNGATVGFAQFETAPRVELFAVGTGGGTIGRVQVYDAGSGQQKLELMPFGDTYTGPVSVATGDVNGDQYPDIIVSAGRGGAPHVKVFDGLFGTELASFFAYAPSFTGGVQVASGDINGDGVADVIIGSGVGGGPHVRVISGADFKTEIMNFFAYDMSFRSGVQVAAGDVNGDGRTDVITGAGPGGGPHVRAFSGKNGDVLANFFAFDPNYRGGVNVTAADVFGDGKIAILAAPAAAGGTTVYAYGVDGTLRTTFNAAGPLAGAILPIAREDGIRMTTADIDGDGVKDVITARGRSTQPIVRAYKLGSTTGSTGTIELIRETTAFGGTYNGGIYVG